MVCCGNERGISDDAVLDLANRESALLLTADKDFGELVFRLGRVASGVILVRLAGLPDSSKATIISEAIARYSEELPGAFAVITPTTVRIRSSRSARQR